ncbi:MULTISPECIES: anti-sigma factor [Roseivirga]|nr:MULTISPECIES: anti-sigma factor [Roseivirga]MBO6497332.1 anti-sigma factor [Roseivirga sp.]WPZ12157.1 anti-sigma factor [Roseivirga spongicola]
MNIEEYISSGILEEYALGALSSEEMMEVEAMMAKYPEIKDELNNIELAFEDMAMATAQTPKRDLKSSILDLIEEEEKPVVKPQPQASPKEEPKVVQMQPSPVLKYAVAASLTLTLVCGYLAVDYRAKWKNTNKAYAELLSNNEQMAEQYNRVRQELGDIESDLLVLTNPDFRRIEMPGTDNAKDAFASVYWNQLSQELYLDIRNLKELSEDQQYQLWAIVDGKPVDAGVFDWNAEGLVRMKNMSNSAAFAVTIEPKGGSENPTLESMQVLGTV